ncbi:MAG: hypothetical protein HY544_02990 [Candidatus Diapherotrites archaeon]|uniref:Uncharacterized protein n=1 Tax=Candidatus Iainarchaeum sp. TaxID=3101447 RepID=A0A8T3YMC9_9ARCH|nr:hypothetical protein [Candidatus Diapherotrites archaeon]
MLKIEDATNMCDFAIELITNVKTILEVRNPETRRYMIERIAIVQLDHATELLMKAFLVEKGFIIEFIEKSVLKDGLKITKSEEETRTIDYGDCLKIVLRNLRLEEDEKTELQEAITKFHKLRNEIQHRATNIPLDKMEKITDFYPQLKKLFEKMFPNKINKFPDFLSV